MAQKAFVIEDPTPWLDQFVSTIGIMVDRAGGTSAEFVMGAMLRGLGNPDHLIIGTSDEGEPSRLTGWVLVVFIRDTYKPWVEVWGMWASPGMWHELSPLVDEILTAWCKEKGATRVVGVITRATRVYLRRFFKPIGFRQTGIVIERSV